MTEEKKIRWSFEPGPDEWDRTLASCGGHPLQSALWGEARRSVDDVEDRRWVAFVDDEPVWMGRFEMRRLPLRGKVAWFPRGPVIIDHPQAMAAHLQALDKLKQERYLICFTNPYPHRPENVDLGISLGRTPQTLWLDLDKDKEVLFSSMHKKLRYGVRAAERAGVVLEQTRNPEDVAAFFQLCDQVSEAKNFDLPGSRKLLQELLCLTRPDSSYRAHLFVARSEGRVVSGYLSIENGSRLHNIWNGTDRAYSKQCPGEAVLWHQVTWGVEASLRIYDQEGIDLENNPGCYKFKMRLGGDIVNLPGLYAEPLNMVGRTLLRMGRWTGKL